RTESRQDGPRGHPPGHCRAKNAQIKAEKTSWNIARERLRFGYNVGSGPVGATGSFTSQSESRTGLMVPNAGPSGARSQSSAAPLATAEANESLIALEDLRKKTGLVSAGRMKSSPVKMPAGGERVFAERDGR